MRGILGISLRDKVPNNTLFKRARLTSIYTILKQRRLRWLGRVSRVEDGRIPKDLLRGDLATGKRLTGRRQLRFKNICKRDLKALAFNTDTWEAFACDRRCKMASPRMKTP